MTCNIWPLLKALDANATNNGYAALPPTKTEPSGAGVFNLADYGSGPIPRSLRVFPFGTDAANETFAIRLTGWSRLRHRSSSASDATLWVPSKLFEATCTIGSSTGIAGTEVAVTDLFVDTLVVGVEPVLVADVTNKGTVAVFSPADNTVGWFETCLYGYEKLQVQFTTGGVAASCNALLEFKE